MGLFSGIEKASSTKGGSWFPVNGKFLVEIVELKNYRTRSKGDSSIAEFVVVESDHEDVKPGQSRSWMVMHSHDSALGNIKNFLSAVVGCAEDEITEEDADEAYGETNPLKGKQVILETHHHTTKAGNDFTKHLWYPAG